MRARRRALLPILDALPAELRSDASPQRCVCAYCEPALAEAERDAERAAQRAWSRTRADWCRANGFTVLQLMRADRPRLRPSVKSQKNRSPRNRADRATSNQTEEKYVTDRKTVQESGKPEMNTRSLDWEPTTRVERGAPLSRVDEDAVVERLLAATDDGVELAGGLSIAAYRSLAKSRGVSLEHVVRAACRGDLSSVVKRPAVTPTTTEKETPA